MAAPRAALAGRFARCSGGDRRKPTADFDGDGVADTFTGGMEAPVATGLRRGQSHGRGSSGRDGHVIWKTIVDRFESWLARTAGTNTGWVHSRCPAGDLDGDGVPDVIVVRRLSGWQVSKTQGLANCRSSFSPGRTGAACGRRSLPVRPRSPAEGFADINGLKHAWSRQRRDRTLVVCYRDWPGGLNLARVSGRDGRIAWDVSLAEDACDIAIRQTGSFYDPTSTVTGHSMH